MSNSHSYVISRRAVRVGVGASNPQRGQIAVDAVQYVNRRPCERSKPAAKSPAPPRA